MRMFKVLVTLDSEILVLSGFVLESHNSAIYTVAAPNPRSTRAAREMLHQIEHLITIGLAPARGRVN
jgi:hypothetical protein